MFHRLLRKLPHIDTHGKISMHASMVLSGLSGLRRIIVGITFACAVHETSVFLNRQFSISAGPAEYRLWPQSAIWWFFPAFGALALAWEITLQVWSFLGNSQDAVLYSAWSAQKAGFDSRKVLRWLAIFVAMPIGVLTALALPMNTALQTEEIRECGFGFRPCQNYRYLDAKRMTLIAGFRGRDGKLTRRAAIVLDFRDGRRWSSALGDFSTSVDPVLLELVERKTGLPLNSAQTADDIPPLR
jgi:hypothetical protein